MGDRYIVSNYRFREHVSFDIAIAERNRLARKCPNQNFRVYRIKTTVVPAGLVGEIIEAANALMDSPFMACPPDDNAADVANRLVDALDALDKANVAALRLVEASE